MIAPDVLDKVVLLAVAGVTEAQLETVCRRKLGLSTRKTREAIASARGRILAAAGQSRREQLGLAILRLTEIFQQAQQQKKPVLAMQAQRELNKLHALHTLAEERPEPTDGDRTDESDQLARIAAHLLPLGLAPEDYPLEEHARLASAAIRNLRSQDASFDAPV